MLVTGTTMNAAEWIASKPKTGHGFRCGCDACRDHMAAQFMQYLLVEAQKDAAKIAALTTAQAAAVRAYRAAMR